MSIFLDRPPLGAYRVGMAETYWDTDEELGFLARLAARPNADALLEGYIRSCDRRTYWGPIDPVAVRARAVSLLDAERRREIA